jgi:hypothetical protein
MGLREELTRKIEKKRQERLGLEQQIRDCDTYIRSIEDVVKMLPRDAENGVESTFRAGSAVALAKDAILKERRPMHVTELLQFIGKANTKNNRLALSGSLAAYVRKQQVFSRPLPNTFYLIELERPLQGIESSVELPDGEDEAEQGAADGKHATAARTS